MTIRLDGRWLGADDYFGIWFDKDEIEAVLPEFIIDQVHTATAQQEHCEPERDWLKAEVALQSFTPLGLRERLALEKENERKADVAWGRANREWKAHTAKHYRQYSGLRGVPITLAPPPKNDELRTRSMQTLEAREEAKEAQRAVIQQMKDVLRDRLEKGELVARGIKPSNLEEEVEIPPFQWRFLELDYDKAEARGNGITYIGVVIANRKDETA